MSKGNSRVPGNILPAGHSERQQDLPDIGIGQSVDAFPDLLHQRDVAAEFSEFQAFLVPRDDGSRRSGMGAWRGHAALVSGCVVTLGVRRTGRAVSV